MRLDSLGKCIFSTVLFATLIGCATHGIMEAEGVFPSGSENLDVIVLSDSEFIRRTPSGLEPHMDIRPDPGLSASFANALARYIDSANVRIISADLAPTTRLNRQHVTFTMLVEANGNTYQLRHDKTTDDAGFFGTNYLKELPEYLDSCANQLAKKLEKHDN